MCSERSVGATLEIVTDKSQEGSQFVRGFGGVGGILRYKVDLQNLNVDEDAEPIDYSTLNSRGGADGGMSRRSLLVSGDYD